MSTTNNVVENVFSSLTPDGVLLCADITVTPDPVLERSLLDGWVAFMPGAGLDPERIPHVLADHRENDLAEPASTQLSYLRAAGFAPAEVIGARRNLPSSTLPGPCRRPPDPA